MLSDRVAKGVAWMDNNVPNWRSDINWAMLSMGDPNKCVLGQTIGYGQAYIAGRGFDWAIEHGFTIEIPDTQEFTQLTEEWNKHK